METLSESQLPPAVRLEIYRIAQQAGADQVILFGSRARGSTVGSSDIDLAVRGGDCSLFAQLLAEEAHLPAQYDLVRLDETAGSAIAQTIAREGVVLYDRRFYVRRLEDFRCQLAVLRSFQPEPAAYDPFYRMGVIGQFQLTFEMAWRALKEVMTRYGVDAAASGSPREIIRLAGQYRFLENPRAWHAMLDRRNAVVHIYDEEAADDLVVLIGERYLPCFAQLLVQLDERMQQLAADEN